MLADFLRALSCVTEHFASAHRMTHEEKRNRTWKQRLDEGCDVVQHLSRGSRVASLRGLLNGTSPSPLVEGVDFDAF
jgi:hypothetical protein